MSAEGVKCPKCGETAYLYLNETGARDDRFILRCPHCKHKEMLTLVGKVRYDKNSKEFNDKDMHRTSNMGNRFFDRYW